MKGIIIDTGIFEYAFVKPKEAEFFQLHQKANIWLRETLKKQDIDILMGTYQIAEVAEVLRKVGASQKARGSFIELAEKRFSKRAISYEVVKEAYVLSSKSNVHIYDYLVVLPFKGEVEEIFSPDRHFQHPDFKSIANVTNPVENWVIVEGKRPWSTLTFAICTFSF